MKLNPKTREILKNFSSINPQLLIQPGKTIRTKSATGDDLLCYAKVEEEFTETCGIHDLSRLLGALSIFADPDVEFTSTVIRISTDRQRVNYTCAPAEMIKDPNTDDVEIESSLDFNLTWDDLNKTVKATSMLGHTDIKFVGSDGTLSIEGANLKDPTSDTFALEIGKTDKSFSVLIPKDRIAFLKRDYNVALSNDVGIRFHSDDVTYYVAYSADGTDVGDL